MTDTEHSTITNEYIAQIALSFIDKYGIEKLSFRKLSKVCGIPPMTILNRLESKDKLMRAVLQIMLDENTSDAIPGETWQQSLRRVAYVHRKMALSHPNAYMLFIQTPPFESPVVEYTMRMFDIHLNQNLPENMPFLFLSLMHSFVSGFQLVESYSVTINPDDLSDNARKFTALFNEEAFDRNLSIIIAGLEASYDLPKE